jgi:hypothetical protein
MFESIPGTVLQIYAVISAYEESQWVQIIIFESVLAVGHISARMSYHLDISLKQREKGSLSLSLSLSLYCIHLCSLSSFSLFLASQVVTSTDLCLMLL